MDYPWAGELSRRTFLKRVAGLGGALVASACAPAALGPGGESARLAGSPSDWSNRLGLQLFTVRDRLFADFEGTLAAVAEAGYREVELFGSLGERTPQQVRAILDRAGLSAPSTHIGVTPGPELERQLEGYRLLGHRYTSVRTGGPMGGPPGGAPGGVPGGAPPAASPAPRPAVPNTPERWQRMAEALNQVGAAGRQYGIRALFHNHTEEFAPLEGAAGTGYDILLAETDADLVVFELDIGWATVAGHNAVEMFRRHPGRFHLWHVKDMADLAAVTSLPTQAERQRAARIVPVGEGEIDYRPIFAAADLAGLRHFFVEQDTAPQQGDSLAAIRTSAQNLKRILS